MQHSINVCKKCSGESIYIHLPATSTEPPEHKIICKSCKYETEVYRYSLGAIGEWNKKDKKG